MRSHFILLIFIAGSAVGFKLDSLLKLSDTRARNNKMTLMHYLCKVDKLKLETSNYHIVSWVSVTTFNAWYSHFFLSFSWRTCYLQKNRKYDCQCSTCLMIISSYIGLDYTLSLLLFWLFNAVFYNWLTFLLCLIYSYEFRCVPLL